MGHLDQTPSSPRHRNFTLNSPTLWDLDQQNPPHIPHILFHTELIDKIYTDLTGHFPHISASGYNYLLIMYHATTGSIISAPIKDRTTTSLLSSYKKLLTPLHQSGHTINMHWLDNEATQALLQFNREHNITYQLTPPHIHRRNAAERSIQTYKNHLIAGLSTTPTQFPIHLWDLLIPQANLTINLL